MAEKVQYYLEQMVPELEDLERKEIFTKEEIKSIIKKRTAFEYALKRRPAQKKKKRAFKAVTKFKGDIKLWLQYIDFAKNEGNNLFNIGLSYSVLQLHPTKPIFWIMASKYEFEVNANIMSARVFLQRGLRLNCDSHQLWHQYFKLELVYVEKIKVRRRILGISNNKDEEFNDHEDSQNFIKIADDDLLKANKLETEGLDRVQEINLDDDNLLFRGELSKVVYFNAIKAIPNDLSFRKEFVNICREFSDIKMVQEEIYESIRRDFKSNPEALSYVIERHVDNISDVHSIEFINSIKHCIDEYQEFIEVGHDFIHSQKFPNYEMWYMYSKFLLKYLHMVSEPNLVSFLNKKLSKTYKNASRSNLASSSMYSDWINWILEKDGVKYEKIKGLLKNATDTWPNNSQLWEKRINVISYFDSNEESESIEELYKLSLKLNPASLILWVSYLSWIFKSINLKDIELENLLLNSISKISSLSQSTHNSKDDKDYQPNEIKDQITTKYLKWAVEKGGLEKARKVYMSLFNKTLPTLKFYQTCIEIEQEYLENSSTSASDPKAHLIWLFEQACGFEKAPIVFTVKLTFAENIQNDNFKESLTIKSLSDGKLLTHFQFNVRIGGIEEGKAFNHYKLFPRAIGQIIQSYNARELHLTFTQGRWNYEDWGYPIVPAAGIDENWKSLTNALAGLFCASLNFIDDTITVQPKLSFRPEGPYNATELSARAELRYGSLPHENVCTENLTPWIKLLPCKSNSGVASLLNGHKLYDSNFHSMSIHVRPVCENSECSRKQLEIVQTVSTVVDPVRNSGKRDWSLNQIFGRRLSQACPLAEESKLEINLPEDGDYKLSPDADDVIRNTEGDTSKAVYNLKNVQSKTDVSMTWKEDLFEYNLNFEQPRVYAHRFFTGYGQERGGIKINIFNRSSNISVPIIYFDVIPWFLKLYLHTLKVQINGVEAQYNPIKDLYYQPAVDRSRPNVIEAELSLPPNSITTLSINFDKVFLKYTEHPPDANRGFDIGSAVISTKVESLDDYKYFHDIETRNCSENMPKTACHHFPIRIYTETLLVSLPTPDFSMPYNVITLTCTVIALFFGSMFNLMTRGFVALRPNEVNEDKVKVK
ncbi:11600_t:CDS:10 [Funneliformis geosporum]|nr:11600_t:CDS:10 [Funneliformis geosporum]